MGRPAMDAINGAMDFLEEAAVEYARLENLVTFLESENDDLTAQVHQLQMDVAELEMELDKSKEGR